MYASDKIKQMDFAGKTMKEAYLSCCKWISTNIIAVNNSQNISYKIEKVQFDGESTYKVRLTIYANVDEAEIKEKYCTVCKEVTGSFFLKQNKHMCETCRLLPYESRKAEKMEIIKKSLKGKVI